VHRDVKPSNIVIDEDDFAYLIDFGIARAATDNSLTHSGAAIGTWAYMAPERFRGADVDRGMDVYALACVLCECLTGAHPYSSKSLENAAAGHLFSPPPRPSQLRAGLPPSFDAVIANGMAKDPTQRYPSTRELASAARAALTGVSVRPRAPGAHAPSEPSAASAPTTLVNTPAPSSVAPTTPVPFHLAATTPVPWPVAAVTPAPSAEARDAPLPSAPPTSEPEVAVASVSEPEVAVASVSEPEVAVASDLFPEAEAAPASASEAQPLPAPGDRESSANPTGDADSVDPKQLADAPPESSTTEADAKPKWWRQRGVLLSAAVLAIVTFVGLTTFARSVENHGVPSEPSRTATETSHSSSTAATSNPPPSLSTAPVEEPTTPPPIPVPIPTPTPTPPSSQSAPPPTQAVPTTIPPVEATSTTPQVVPTTAGQDPPSRPRIAAPTTTVRKLGRHPCEWTLPDATWDQGRGEWTCPN
jgi:serine/threonine protein kinase